MENPEMSPKRSETNEKVTPDQVDRGGEQQVEKSLTLDERTKIEKDDTMRLNDAKAAIQTLPDGPKPPRYVSKDEMGPAYGWDTDPPTIREDLPSSVKSFVGAHERYHIKNPTDNWLRGEIKASIAGALRHPIGFARTAWMSLTSRERLRFYRNQIRQHYGV
ncbi:hypothetical protein ACFL0L_00975 [Patescibacteria group bacterium]